MGPQIYYTYLHSDCVRLRSSTRRVILCTSYERNHIRMPFEIVYNKRNIQLEFNQTVMLTNLLQSQRKSDDWNLYFMLFLHKCVVEFCFVEIGNWINVLTTKIYSRLYEDQNNHTICVNITKPLVVHNTILWYVLTAGVRHQVLYPI